MHPVEQLAQKSGVHIQPTRASEIKTLSALGLAKNDVVFDDDSSPTRRAKIGEARLCLLSDILIENDALGTIHRKKVVVQFTDDGKAADLDCLVDVALELAKSLTGFRHNEAPPDMTGDVIEILEPIH